MKNYEIRLNPARAGSSYGGSRGASAPEMFYDLEFVIDGKAYGYYPADAIMTLNTLHMEMEALSARQDHTVAITGYPVLRIEFRDADDVVLLDPVAVGKDGKPKIIGLTKVSLMEEALRSAVHNLEQHATL